MSDTRIEVLEQNHLRSGLLVGAAVAILLVSGSAPLHSEPQQSAANVPNHAYDAGAPVAQAPEQHEELDGVATFSILGYDPETGLVGGAVQSRVFSVGNGVLWGEANVGMVATQAIVDVSYGPQALGLLRQGMAPADIVETIWENDLDPGYRGRPWPKAGRQFSVMNAQGEVATFTGPEASDWPATRSANTPAPRATSSPVRRWSTI